MVTPTGALVLFATAWVAIGFGTAYLMARRGHDPFTWWYMGAVLGPLTIPMAITKLRQHDDAAPAEVTSGTREGGSIDVLVGMDGSPESHRALEDAIRVVGSRIGRLCLATVEDFDAPMRSDGAAESVLREAASKLPYRDPTTVVLTGKPADALLSYASSQAYDLLVVGSRGRGMSKLLLGSVAQQMARSAGIPVLISRRA